MNEIKTRELFYVYTPESHPNDPIVGHDFVCSTSGFLIYCKLYAPEVCGEFELIGEPSINFELDNKTIFSSKFKHDMRLCRKCRIKTMNTQIPQHTVRLKESTTELGKLLLILHDGNKNYEYTWGKIANIIGIGHYTIVVFYKHEYKNGVRTGTFEVRPSFSAYCNPTDFCVNYPTLEEALIGMVVHRHGGPNDHSAQVLCNHLKAVSQKEWK